MKNPICFALDFPTLAEASYFVSQNSLWDHVGAVKVGLELFIASGPAAVDVFSKDMEIPVVLDLKLHDIPETVSRAIKAAGDMGVKFMTLHIQQRATLELAQRTAESFGIKLLGVTVLTSMDVPDLSDLSLADTTVESRVYRLARFGRSCGLSGFVCSPQETSGMNERFPDSFLLVPGIRPKGVAAGDQKRVGTPKQAIDDGANFLVIGRPIRDASDPVKAAQDILREIEGGKQ